MQIPVVRNVLEANEKIAASVREKLRERKILALNLISSPGAGKTTLLERTLHDLAGEFRMAVIEGDLQTDNDARRVAATGAQAVQINTDGGCHLDSNMIMTAMESLDLDGVDILFIENVGNLVCPVEFDCGEDAKVALLSVTEGDDKPEKYPLLFNLAKAMVLNKVDLLPYVDFDRERARDFATRLNKELAVFEVSCRDGSGLEAGTSGCATCAPASCKPGPHPWNANAPCKGGVLFFRRAAGKEGVRAVRPVAVRRGSTMEGCPRGMSSGWGTCPPCMMAQKKTSFPDGRGGPLGRFVRIC